MTNKNSTSASTGGPWTPRFKEMAEKAGMRLDDAANKVRVPGHRGPHPQPYHDAVYKRLEDATRGLSGKEYADKFRAELEAIRQEVQTPGSVLNQMLTQ